jgi:hypothetical protein
MCRQYPVFIVLIFAFQSVFAQDSVAVHYAKKITGADIKPFLEVLASDSLEGRETGEPGQKKAAAFIADHFQSLGLKPISHGTYLQHISLTARVNAGKNFVVNEKNFVFMRDYFYPRGIFDSLVVLDKIFFAGYGLSQQGYDDYRSIDPGDHAVLFFETIPEIKKKKNSLVPATLSSRIHAAAEKGVRLALIITDSLTRRAEEYSYGQQHAGQEIPFAFVTREVAKSFFPEISEGDFEKTEKKIKRSGKPKSFVLNIGAQLSFVKNTETLTGENVLGFLEGTDKKEEVLVLTAHYDHLGIRDSLLYPGADDDGSGTSAVMEMAKIFSDACKEGHCPRRSILFMTVAGEEKGLLGSRYYVKNPVIPLGKMIADLNTDMIGRTDPKHDSLNIRDYVYIIGSDKLSTTLHRINERANEAFTHLNLDYTYNRPDDPNRFYYRSDHYNFARNNIPVIFYFNGVHADYHRPSDTIDKIQFDLLAKRTQLIFLTAWELANREERITVDVKSDMPNKSED